MMSSCLLPLFDAYFASKKSSRVSMRRQHDRHRQGKVRLFNQEQERNSENPCCQVLAMNGCIWRPPCLEHLRSGDWQMKSTQGGNNVNRLEFIFQAVNAIASKRHDAVTEYMLAQAILHEIDTVKGERRTKAVSAGSCR